jgi:acyl-CoA hydrolase
MVTTSSFAEKMNALVEEEAAVGLEQNAIQEEGVVLQERVEEDIRNEEPNQDPVETPETVTFEDVAAGIEENEDDVPDLEPQGDDESDDEADDESEDEESVEGGETMARRSACIRAGVKKPARYAMHTKLKRGTHNDEATNEQIKAAEKAEIQLVFKDL